MSGKIIIILENERPMSWNTLYAGNHWIIRKTEADRVHKLIHYSLLQKGFRPQKNLYDKKVSITVIAYFKNRPLDADNICSKFYIDGLKEMLIRDDDPKYVTTVTCKSLVDKENPRVEMILEEI